MIYVRCCVTNMVLIRNNGEAVAFGDNDGGQGDVPALPPSTRYVQAALRMVSMEVSRWHETSLYRGAIGDPEACCWV